MRPGPKKTLNWRYHAPQIDVVCKCDDVQEETYRSALNQYNARERCNEIFIQRTPVAKELADIGGHFLQLAKDIQQLGKMVNEIFELYTDAAKIRATTAENCEAVLMEG